MRIDLEIAALRDIDGDGADLLPVLRVAGPAPRLTLRADGALAPGEYFFEARARAISGELGLSATACFVGGGEQSVELAAIAVGLWRGVLRLERATAALALDIVGAEALVFGGALVEAESGETGAAPSLRTAALMLARALFRKLPLRVRRALVGSGRRARWLARARPEAETSVCGAPGRIVAASEAADTALRADFENRFATARGIRHAAYSDEAPPAAPPVGAAKLVAFHLPQFHPIPENDAWWGRGFTEWNNVAKAAPQFVGHDQPRLPGELGFYDLRTPGVLKQQAALARAYGLSAFCFHYYWFSGKRLLEAPLDAFLLDKSIEFDFCLCWANENWTRRWDGDERQVLIAQRHSMDDHARVFDDLARYMEDPRYLRVAGKPLLVVYRPDIIDDVGAMTALWRRLAVERGWAGVFLVATNAFRFDDAKRLGFDALVEFPPHGLLAHPIGERLSWLNPTHPRSVFDYGEVAHEEAARGARRRDDVLPGVMPGWDNEARRPGAGAIYHGATPAAYGAWLRAAIARAQRDLPPDRRFVFINAWNEWAEAAYLEPDRRFGRAFLVETARALSGR